MLDETKLSTDILTKVSFRQIFFFWIGYASVLGVLYYLLSQHTTQGLLYNTIPLESSLAGFLTAEYFSFSAAALGFQGYGVLPLGISRLIAIVEAVSGWVFFSVIISKLLSQKQEILLQEVYDISFDEKINRIRSALYLFRSDVSKIIDKVENNALAQRTINDLWITFTTLETTTYEITKIVHPRKNTQFVKNIDDLNLELVLNSMSMSLAKARDLFTLLNHQKIKWQSDMIQSIMVALSASITRLKQQLKDKEANKKIIEKMSEVLILSEELQDQAKMSIAVEVAHAVVA